jgi:hypothetical protein
MNLTCSYKECDYNNTFSRKLELRRHIAAKHEKEKAYRCPVVGCIKVGNAPGFARLDKLTAHIRAVHYGNGAKAVCPAASRADKAVDLDLFATHAKLQHLEHRQGGVSGRILRALANAVSADYRRCPICSCKARLGLDDVPSHLLSHPSDKLTIARPGLALEGYVVGKSDCEHREGDAGLAADWCVCGMSSIQVACPVCRSCCWDRQGLKAHIEEVQIQVREVVTSFR